jgi:hypothetical protein
MKNAPDSPDSPAHPAASGARNDDSSLFSLASLKLTQAATQQGKTAEDSGLIDLNSLGVIEKDAAPGAARSPLAVAPVVAPNDIFGSAGTPMLIAPSASAVATAAPGAEAPPAKSKGMVMIVGGVAAVGLAVGVFLAMRGGGDAPATKPTVAVTAAPAPTTAPTPTAVAAPEPTVAAVTPGQRPVAEPTAAPTVAPVAKLPGPMPVAKAPGGSKAAAPAAKAEPPAKPVETCDLACQMQRAVQKK